MKYGRPKIEQKLLEVVLTSLYNLFTNMKPRT